MSDTIKIIFKGVDEFTGVTGKISSQFGRVGSVIKGAGLAGAAGLAALTAGTIKAGSVLVNLGSDAEETGSLIQTSLGNATEGFNQQLRDFASEANRSFYELQEGSSTIVAMTKAMGAGEQGAADFGVQFGMMASDLGSFFNRTDAEVFLDLQSALGGSSETLQKYGVDIRETTLKQMALNQGLIESASDILPPLTRATLIQQAIQEQATDAMGDAIRTSDSWSNSMRGLKGRLRDTFTELGTKLIPIMTPLLNLVGDLATQAVPYLTRAFEWLLPILDDVVSFIRGFIQGLRAGYSPLEAIIDSILTWTDYGSKNWDMLIGLADTIENQWIPAIKNAIASVVEFITPIKQWIADNIQLSDVLTGLAIILGGVVLGAIVSVVAAMAPIILTIGAVIGAVALLRTAWENDFLGIRTTITAWAEEHGGIMQGIKDWWTDLMVTWNQLTVIITIGVSAIKVGWAQLKLTWSQLKVIILAGVLSLKNSWIDFKTTIGGLVTQIKQIWDGLQSKFEAVKAGITAALQPIIDMIHSIGNALGGLALPDWMTPGSPTPWEMGLRGVRDELQALYRGDLPALSAGMQGLQNVSNRTQNVNQTTNIYTSQVDTRGESDAAMRFALGGI